MVVEPEVARRRRDPRLVVEGGTTTVNKAGDATAQTPPPPPLPPEPGQGSLPTQTCCAVRGRPLAWASTWTIPVVVLHMSSAQGGELRPWR